MFALLSVVISAVGYIYYMNFTELVLIDREGWNYQLYNFIVDFEREGGGSDHELDDSRLAEKLM